MRQPYRMRLNDAEWSLCAEKKPPKITWMQVPWQWLMSTRAIGPFHGLRMLTAHKEDCSKSHVYVKPNFPLWFPFNATSESRRYLLVKTNLSFPPPPSLVHASSPQMEWDTRRRVSSASSRSRTSVGPSGPGQRMKKGTRIIEVWWKSHCLFFPPLRPFCIGTAASPPENSARFTGYSNQANSDSERYLSDSNLAVLINQLNISNNITNQQ